MDQQSDGIVTTDVIVTTDEPATTIEEDTGEPEPGLRFTIASFGAEGNAATELLGQSHYLDSGGYGQDTVSFVRLDEFIAAIEIHNIVARSDLVFILGSDDQITTPSPALSLALICQENSTPCYTILTATTSWEQTDVATKNLCSLSSNVFRMPFTKPVNHLVSCGMMKDAALNIINPLFGIGIICVDFADIQTILGLGKATYYTSAKANGMQRAAEAARTAISQLPSIESIKGIICNITGGCDLTMEDVEKAGDEVHAALAEDATVILSTTLDPEMDGEIFVGVTGVY